ncbi:MAG: WD40 repeat domain-containing protein [Pirellulaceae bacterium]|nr:WD40 repeat domain-containing protein [Pirellulaceae bacterium]
MIIRSHLRAKRSGGAVGRRWALMAIAASAVACPSGWGDEPSLSVAAKQNLMRSMTPIASRAIQLEATTAQLPRAVVTAIAADPRGDLVAVAGDDHAIRILNTSTMRIVQTLDGHRDLIRTLSFSHSGDQFVSAGNDGQLIVWDRDASFTIMQRMQGTPALACVRFAPDDNEMAAVGFDNTVFVIGRKPRPKTVFECHCKDLRAIAYRDDNRLLAVAGRSGSLHLFDPANGELVLEQKIHNGRVHDLEFHRDAYTLVSVGADGMMVVFDTKRNRVLSQTRVSTGKLFAVSILDSVHVAVAGSDNVIRVVNTDDGQVVRKLEGHHGSIPSLAFTNGKLFSGGFDATLRRWTLDHVTGNQQRIAEGDHGIDR